MMPDRGRLSFGVRHSADSVIRRNCCPCPSANRHRGIVRCGGRVGSRTGADTPWRACVRRVRLRGGALGPRVFPGAPPAGHVHGTRPGVESASRSLAGKRRSRQAEGVFPGMCPGHQPGGGRERRAERGPARRERPGHRPPRRSDFRACRVPSIRCHPLEFTHLPRIRPDTVTRATSTTRSSTPITRCIRNSSPTRPGIRRTVRAYFRASAGHGQRLVGAGIRGASGIHRFGVPQRGAQPARRRARRPGAGIDPAPGR